MTSIRKWYYRKKYKIPDYVPAKFVQPQKSINVVSAWNGLEMIIPDIISRFQLGDDRCIEFGVEFGYSTVVFSNYFKKVMGIDTFEGDMHTDFKENHFEKTSKSLSKFENIELVQSTYQDWINEDEQRYDLAHVDIVHTYYDTFACGFWAATHSKCALFHDTESYPEVRRAVVDIAKNTGKKLFNYPHHNGLGIIV